MTTSLDSETVLHDETLRGGAGWSIRLRRGLRLRLTDINGGANVSMFMHNAEEMIERYNMSDSLKAQHTFYMSEGRSCISDMGRVLMSVVEDTVGWHDTVTGCSDAKQVEAQFGTATYQEHRNNMYRNSRDNLLVELGKFGLGKRDVHAPINWFTKIAPNEDGEISFVEGHSPVGGRITLRADMDVIVCLTTNQHPMDPNPTYDPKPVRIEILAGEPAAADDPCRLSSEQAARAFQLTDLYHIGAK